MSAAAAADMFDAGQEGAPAPEVPSASAGGTSEP